jgi:hypothetical protein
LLLHPTSAPPPLQPTRLKAVGRNLVTAAAAQTTPKATTMTTAATATTMLTATTETTQASRRQGW